MVEEHMPIEPVVVKDLKMHFAMEVVLKNA